jgi:hypothetical protein
LAIDEYLSSSTPGEASHLFLVRCHAVMLIPADFSFRILHLHFDCLFDIAQRIT